MAKLEASTAALLRDAHGLLLGMRRDVVVSNSLLDRATGEPIEGTLERSAVGEVEAIDAMLARVERELEGAPPADPADARMENFIEEWQGEDR